MSTITFQTLQDQVQQCLGSLSATEIDQLLLDLITVIGASLEVDEIAPEQFQIACQLINIIQSGQASTAEEANAILSGTVIEVSPQHPLDQMLEQQATEVIGEIPSQVSAAKQDMQRGIQRALAERVAQKLKETDISAKVEELQKQQPPEPQVSFLELLGLPPVPPSSDPKRLTGS